MTRSLLVLASTLLFIAGCAANTEPEPGSEDARPKTSQGDDKAPSVEIDGVKTQSCADQATRACCVSNCLGNSYHSPSLVHWCGHVCAQ